MKRIKNTLKVKSKDIKRSYMKKKKRRRLMMIKASQEPNKTRQKQVISRTQSPFLN